jgi:hypothetical protein
MDYHYLNKVKTHMIWIEFIEKQLFRVHQNVIHVMILKNGKQFEMHAKF